MSTVRRISTRVQAGGKIEVDAPDLQEGREVEVIVLVPSPADPARKSAIDLIASLPIGPRSCRTWVEFEGEFREERDSWDR